MLLKALPLGVSVELSPKAYLIGAQKAGTTYTTYLAALLDQYPRIGIAQPKEPHFFTRNWGKGLSCHRSCFPDPDDELLLLDASPSYSAAPLHESKNFTLGGSRSPEAGFPDRIFQVAPDARFIYILRDPVDRTHSAYWHAVRMGEEQRGFRQALSGDHRYLNMSGYLGQIRH